MYSQSHFYSSNPFLSSFPQPTLPSESDAPLYPPGTEPHGNSTSYLSAPHAYGNPTAYQPTVGSSHETSTVSTSLPSAWNGTWPHQFPANDTTVVLPNQTKVTKTLRCEVCKIDCNSKEVYEKHISGKKHKKNLQVKTNPTATISSATPNASEQSQTSNIQGISSGGATTDSVRVCTTCNIVCNSQEVYNKHLAGKKHAAQVRLRSSYGIGPHLAAFKRDGISPQKKAPNKIKVSQPAWCEICKINCNSKDVYVTHLSGKKHLKNLEKLSKSKNDVGAAATAAIAMVNTSQHTTNLIIGPQEKPDTDKPKSRKAPEKDVEAKKRKVVESGADAAAVRLCTLCNVVCNSETVLNAHLFGQKHTAMMKKQAESRGAATG